MVFAELHKLGTVCALPTRRVCNIRTKEVEDLTKSESFQNYLGVRVEWGGGDLGAILC